MLGELVIKRLCSFQGDRVEVLLILRSYPLHTAVPCCLDEQVMWRGRTFDPENPNRDAMRRSFVECPVKLTEEGKQEDARLFNVDGGSYMLTDIGDFR